MFLNKISILNFKNLKQEALELSTGINCFVGSNGAGKTNVLDAVHYLSMCKSALTMTDSQCVCHGEDFFVLDALYETDDDKRESVVCSFKKAAGKVIKRNGKEYGRIAEHIGLLPLVIISPSDSFLITDSAEERRRFMNSFLSQLDKDYINAIIRYNHVLAERNRLLKEGYSAAGSEILDVLDAQLTSHAEIVHSKRRHLIDEMSPLLTQYYSSLTEGREDVTIEYRSELNNDSLSNLLINSREKDRINQHTTCGIHRDDLKMHVNGYTLRKYGSQGQQKSFLIALKLAQFTLLAKHKNEKPILLLDDIFDKLDMNRVEKLLNIVSGDNFSQILITDCNKVRLEGILNQSGKPFNLFEVENGKIGTA